MNPVLNRIVLVRQVWVKISVIEFNNSIQNFGVDTIKHFQIFCNTRIKLAASTYFGQ
jgi:hypothetical protein